MTVVGSRFIDSGAAHLPQFGLVVNLAERRESQVGPVSCGAKSGSEVQQQPVGKAAKRPTLTGVERQTYRQRERESRDPRRLHPETLLNRRFAGSKHAPPPLWHGVAAPASEYAPASSPPRAAPQSELQSNRHTHNDGWRDREQEETGLTCRRYEMPQNWHTVSSASMP